MDFDAPREAESTSMDIDDGAFTVSCCHQDSVEMNAPGPSGRRMPSDEHLQRHQIFGSVDASIQSLPGLPFTTLPLPSSPSNHLGMGGNSKNPSVRQVPPRKRKHSDDSHPMDLHLSQEDGAFADRANSRSARRIRPRLRKRPQDREFSPLLIMSPRLEQDLPQEETISAFHYSLGIADPSRSVQRSFYPETREPDPNALQGSTSPEVNDPEAWRHRGRSDSTTSFAEVALASTNSSKHSDLSSLSDFGLPRPFEEAKQPCMGSINVVHERGLDAPPSFFSSHAAGRARSPGSAVLPPESGSTNFFDKPRCDSPDPMEPGVDGDRAH